MKRRDFSRGLLAAGLAAPPVLGPTSAVATIKEEDDSGAEQFVRMQLALTTGTVLITWVLLMFPQILGLDFRRTVARYTLQRAALGGLLLGLQHTPFDRRFRNAVLLGNIVLISNMLLILPLLQPSKRPSRLIVANDDYEYVHPGAPGPVNIKGLPSRSQLDRRRVIGTAGINDDNEVGLNIPPLGIKFQF